MLAAWLNIHILRVASISCQGNPKVNRERLCGAGEAELLLLQLEVGSVMQLSINGLTWLDFKHDCLPCKQIWMLPWDKRQDGESILSAYCSLRVCNHPWPACWQKWGIVVWGRIIPFERILLGPNKGRPWTSTVSTVLPRTSAHKICLRSQMFMYKTWTRGANYSARGHSHQWRPHTWTCWVACGHSASCPGKSLASRMEWLSCQ